LGDVKLVAMLAAWLGASRTALCFLLAVVAAALFGLMATGGQAFRRAQPELGQNPDTPATWGTMRLPLGAFLCAGGLYALFFGEQTLQWYFSFWS
jgi:leader peptidase (prepilin peptidase)/N-methyltransferase